MAFGLVKGKVFYDDQNSPIKRENAKHMLNQGGLKNATS